MPVNMPDYAFSNIAVSPELSINSERTEGGLIITSRRSDPYWTGPMTTRPLTGWRDDNEHADFRAFLTQCVDLNMRVDFVHPRHRVPAAYTIDNFPMAGNGALVSVTDLRTIVVSGLTNGLTLRRGDRLSIIQGNLIAHRWIAAPVVVSSAISQSLPLTPRLPIGVFVAGAVVALKDPKMRVMIVPGSWNGDEVGNPTPITFEVSESLT